MLWRNAVDELVDRAGVAHEVSLGKLSPDWGCGGRAVQAGDSHGVCNVAHDGLGEDVVDVIGKGDFLSQRLCVAESAAAV